LNFRATPKLPASRVELVKELSAKSQHAFKALSAAAAIVEESPLPVTSTEGGSMSNNTKQVVVPKWLAMAAVAVGLVGGSYGIASAASSSGATTTTTPAPRAAATAQRPWGGQRSDERPLTGDALAKVTAAAQAKVSGGTIIRVETDADGNATYEAHMTNASGAPVTVYVDKDYNVVSAQTR
jgi:hypothetical protein